MYCSIGRSSFLVEHPFTLDTVCHTFLIVYYSSIFSSSSACCQLCSQPLIRRRPDDTAVAATAMEVAAATKPTAMEAMVGAIAEAMATEDVEQEAAEVTP